MITISDNKFNERGSRLGEFILFQRLFEDYFRSLVTYSYRYVNDWSVGEDIVQDVFMALWINRDKIDFEEPIKPYLYRATYNRSINYLNSVSVQRRVDHADMLDELIDRFGEPPRPVQNLLRVAQLKAEAHSLYFVEIKESSNDITFRMFERAKVNGSNIPLVVEKNKPLLSFVPDKKEPYFYYRKQKNSPDTIEVICHVLADCQELLKE